MTAVTRRIGLIVGSARAGGNGAGLAAWLSPIIKSRLNKSPGQTYDVVTVDPVTAPLPLGPLTDGSRFPAQIQNVEDYPSERVRDWSKFVSGCSGFVVLSPEYNGGYPGELKHALDHLFYEWQKKPAVLVTYGSQGGGRCAAQLKDILTNLQLQLTNTQPQIKLPPKEFVAGEQRVLPGQPAPDFLKEFEGTIEKAADELYELTNAQVLSS
ncbi:flavoprotein [Panus rudis PR-1116 ss-1]|nr:flavoprotein [Panus rudis PR-1116 ss-1]